MVRLHCLAAGRSGLIGLLLLTLVAMVALHSGCSIFGGSDDGNTNNGADNNSGSPSDGDNNSDGGASPDPSTPLEDDFVQGTGALEGYIYVSPARSVGLRQASGNFVLSAAPNPSGIVPTAGTRVLIGGASLATTLDEAGHYAFESAPAQVLSLGVQETLEGGIVVSETFSGVLVAPGHTTFGAEAPTGVSIALSPTASALQVGDSLTASAKLRDDAGDLTGFRDFDWSTSVSGVATVNAGGTDRAQVRAVGNGEASIQAAAGPLAAALEVTVSGTSAGSTSMGVQMSLSLAAEGQDTRVTALSIQPEEGASVTVSAGATAAFLIASPDGSTRTVPARTVGQSLAPDGSFLLRSADSGGTERASISLVVSGGNLWLRRGTAGSLSIQNRLQLSFPLTGPGAAILPAAISLNIPLTGSLEGLTISMPGLPDGATATVILSQSSGAQVSGAGVSSGGELVVGAFPDMPIPDDITNVVISITGP